jgi:cardiolipin synthase
VGDPPLTDQPPRPGEPPRRRLGFRRLSGLDRSGPPPPETLPDAPWNVWTIPNAIGFARIALVPVFLAVSLSSDTGRDALAATLFAVIGWSDYLDGLTARITGQYSRLGALLDPIVDRMLVLSGVVVCWHFDLLPHWALALAVAREVFMLVAGRAALRRGVEIRINWFGRIGIAPVLGGLFFPMCGLLTLGKIMFLVGLGFALVATVFYARDAMAQIASRRAAP